MTRASKRRGDLALFGRNTSSKVVRFQSAYDLDRSEFEAGADNEVVVKRALVMVEGTHVDSAKRKHEFPPERIQLIVDNTNDLLASGGRVPWQQDHKKTQDANIGDLEGFLETRIIRLEDLPNPASRHLVGRLGAFTTELVAKGRDVVRQIKAGRIKTLSPGIDVAKNVIREISATPTPAIVGLSTFRRADFASTPLTFDQMEAETESLDEARSEFDQLADTFWQLVQSINDCGEDEMDGGDPNELMARAISDYGDRLAMMLGVGMEEEPEEQEPKQGGSQGVGAYSLDRVERRSRLTEFNRRFS